MKLKIILILVVLLFSSVASAQSLSDLDTMGLERQTENKIVSHTNPFAGGSLSAEDMAVEDLQLAGIVYRDPGDAFALISGYLVKPGDKIAGYRVDKIEKDRVMLKRLDEVIILAIEGGF